MKVGVFAGMGAVHVSGTGPRIRAEGGARVRGHHGRPFRRVDVRIFGCGFSTIEVGTGCIDVAGVIDVLKDRKEIRYSTLEVAGTPGLLRASAKYIEDRWNA